MENIFFSIIIPSHNESNTIKTTLFHIKQLEYPKDSLEVIVVENGSTDETWQLIQEFDFGELNVITCQSEKGVSRARNFGAKKISDKSDWVIFLDADTILKVNFLSELNQYLNSKSLANKVIGTTEILPYLNPSKKARVWFKVYDWGHKYTQTSYSIQICKSKVARKIHYNTNLYLAEDLQYIKDAKKFGKFFFFPTKTVFTSTRRFEQTGYWKLFFYWIFFGLMPRFIRQKINYKVLR